MCSIQSLRVVPVGLGPQLPQQLTHGYTLYWLSFPSFLPTPVSPSFFLGHFSNKRPAPKFFSQDLLWEKPKLPQGTDSSAVVLSKRIYVTPSKALFSTSWYPHSLVCVPQKQILTQGFHCKLFIWEVIPENAVRVRKGDREGLEDIKGLLSNQLLLWAAGAQSWGGIWNTVEQASEMSCPRDEAAWVLSQQLYIWHGLREAVGILPSTSGMTALRLTMTVWPEKRSSGGASQFAVSSLWRQR